MSFYYDYNPEVVDFCRALKDGFGWQQFSFANDDGKKRWVFSQPMFIQILKEKYPDLDIDPTIVAHVNGAQQVIQEIKKKEENIEQIRVKTTSDLQIRGLKQNLYDYQKVGVEFLSLSGGKAIIADPPGVGKTAQALGYSVFRKFERILVVCPATVKYSWESEVEKWTSFSSVVIGADTDVSRIDPSIRVWIVNYDLLTPRKRKDADTGRLVPNDDRLRQFSKIRFDMLVLDEAHYIKTPSAGRTKAIRLLSRQIPEVVMLTGTPLLSRPVELFSLLNIIDPVTWDNYYAYTRRYCAGKQTFFGYDVSGASNVDELHQRIRRYFLRRQKSEVLAELPSKNHIYTPVKMDDKTERLYHEAELDLARYLKLHKGKANKEIAQTLRAEKLAKLNVLRQLCSRGKIETASDIINAIINAGEKVVVFSSFVETLETLKEWLTARKIKSVMIHGGVADEDRKKAVQDFQNDPSVSVFLGGIKSAGVGITLTAATNVLFVDYSWNPADHQQGEDRIHRPGATAESVNIYQLSAKGTIDNKLESILQHKRKIFDRVIEGATSDIPVVQDETKVMQLVLDDVEERQNLT